VGEVWPAPRKSLKAVVVGTLRAPTWGASVARGWGRRGDLGVRSAWRVVPGLAEALCISYTLVGVHGWRLRNLLSLEVFLALPLRLFGNHAQRTLSS
jgi:hypothetical protein